MIDVVTLIGCGKAKALRPRAAKDLYVGSYFCACKRYAEHTTPGRWGILSAKHGLLDPEQLVEPYELTLNKMSRAEIAAWGLRVNGQIKKRWPGARFIVLAGSRYRIALNGLPFEAPFAKLGMGQQMKKMKAKK